MKKRYNRRMFPLLGRKVGEVVEGADVELEAEGRFEELDLNAEPSFRLREYHGHPLLTRRILQRVEFESLRVQRVGRGILEIRSAERRIPHSI
jgi:hypothetical protein